LAEWVDLENRSLGVKSFAVHPGAVATEAGLEYARKYGLDSSIFKNPSDLSAWTQVRLTSGSEDWLSGRYIDATWDLDRITELKEKIIEQDALKNRLALPI